MPARMFRAPASVVRRAGKRSFVQDNGLMRGGPPASDGNYWFSEVGAGVKPLVLVGTHNDITAFLMKRKESGIKNTIASLPDIYMGIAPYKPAPRYVGLFPFHDAIMQLVTNLARFVPGSPLTDLGGVPGDIRDGVKAKGYAKTYSSKSAKAPANMVAITWSYLQFKRSEKIGSGLVTFAAMYGYIDGKLGAMYGV